MKTVTAIEYALSTIPKQVIDLYINCFVQQYQMIDNFQKNIENAFYDYFFHNNGSLECNFGEGINSDQISH